MKKYNKLEELLLDYTNALLDMNESNENNNSEKLANDFCSNNSLALGKQKPLAKNKQFDDVCECKTPNISQDNTGSIYCFDCKRQMFGQT